MTPDDAGTQRARPVLTLTEAAAATGKSRRTVGRLLDAGRFDGAQRDDAGTWRIPVDALLAAGLTLHAPSPPTDASADVAPVVPTWTPSPSPDELTAVRAELADWRRRAEVAEAVAEERGAALADLRRLVAPITAAPIGTGAPHDRMTAAPIPEPPAAAGDRRARWWRR